MITTKHATLSMLAAFALAPLATHATLIGDTIGVSFTSTEGSGSTTVEVTNAIEFVGPGFGLVAGEFVDITGDSIVAAVVEPFDPGGSFYEFTDLDWVGEQGRIVGVSLTLENIIGLALSDITFGDDFVRVNVSDTDAGPDGDRGVLTIGLETEHDPGPVPVPEPGTLALLGSGLLGLGWVRRKRTA